MSFLTKHEERRIRAKARILEYCKDPHGFNEIVRLLTRDKVYSRMKTKEILGELVQDGSMDLKKGGSGLRDVYVTNLVGALEIERARQLLAGKISGAIPIAPMELSMTFNTRDLPPGIVSETLFRSQKEILQNPQKSKELGTLLGSIVLSFVQQNIDDSTVAKGAFTADGKFTLVTIFSRTESLRFREMVDSGRFQKGNEVVHLSRLLYILGTRSLFDLYRSHERGNFAAKTIAATFMGLRIDEGGLLDDQLVNLNKLEMARRMKKEIETQIGILSSRNQS